MTDPECQAAGSPRGRCAYAEPCRNHCAVEHPTREAIIAVATAVHDQECGCDPRYLMSCPRMAAAILAGARR